MLHAQSRLANCKRLGSKTKPRLLGDSLMCTCESEIIYSIKFGIFALQHETN